MQRHASIRAERDAIRPLLKAGYIVRQEGCTVTIHNPATGDTRSIGNLPRRGPIERAGWYFTEQRAGKARPTESPETRRRRNLTMAAAIERIARDRRREMDRVLAHYEATK